MCKFEPWDIGHSCCLTIISRWGSEDCCYDLYFLPTLIFFRAPLCVCGWAPLLEIASMKKKVTQWHPGSIFLVALVWKQTLHLMPVESSGLPATSLPDPCVCAGRHGPITSVLIPQQPIWSVSLCVWVSAWVHVLGCVCYEDATLPSFTTVHISNPLLAALRMPACLPPLANSGVAVVQCFFSIFFFCLSWHALNLPISLFWPFSSRNTCLSEPDFPS